MVGSLFRAVFGTKHERDAKRMRPAVAAINVLEPALQALDDAALLAKTDEFRKRLADGADIDDLLRRHLRRAGKRRGGRCGCATSTSS